MNINGVILAAGLSSRMKEFKPLMKLRGKTIIENSIDSMFNVGVNKVVLVLGHRAKEVEALLYNKYDPLRLIFVKNKNYAETDMLTSIKIGISELDNCDAFYLLPGDMPAINTKTFIAVKENMCRTHAMVSFPTIDGYKKHPPLISSKCIDYILNFNEQGGLREIWKQLQDQIATVPVKDIGCTLDADTTEDYNRLVNYMEGYN
ncbi:nucleotidyltransferase family protein [Clostridium weizhouense]|uniref:Nucleotidyltransferase family protein n=1 Tax=Clostridium weizhouense TaxID=2859781 RepID=A0ABS7AQR0_9CLOT|nr:nucleotidyltransferase family protein [Clostridium weizhouense]MBW6410994.1 nucleotidyltransferase family protein [Clostridium weizhouense]